MRDTILVPHDGSTQSGDALDRAMAATLESEVLLLHVIEPYAGTVDRSTFVAGEYEQRRENAAQRLDAAAEGHDTDRIEQLITVGRPVHEVLRVTEERGVDEILMGSHGRDGAARLLLGSVAETVVRRAPVPVTVARHDQEGVTEPEQVLVPFDGSTAARSALEHALDKFEDAAVTALFVLHPPTSTTNPGVTEKETGALAEWDEKRHEHAETVLSAAEEVAGARDRQVSTVETGGEPAEAILDYVETSETDHVVLGSTGRDGLARLLLGSVAETVVRRSPVSVTVVK